MRNRAYALALGLAIATGSLIGACSTPSSSTAAGVCADIAKLPPLVTTALAAEPATSALGVLWADAKAGCATGSTASTDWTGMVWGMIRTLAPTVIPLLATLI